MISTKTPKTPNTYCLEMYQDNQPHLIVYGETSSGKHQTVLEFLHKKYNPIAHYKHAVHWISCMNPDIQKDLSMKVKEIGTMVYRPWASTAPKHRVIVMDGIEYIPYTAQASLRRCIELYSEHTRFILIGHHYDILMKPIQSRFVMVQFTHTTSMPVKDVMRTFGKQSTSKKECRLSLCSLRSLDNAKECQEEYERIRVQLDWLNTYIHDCPADTSCTIMARDWICRGWSMLDGIALLVYETQVWLSEHDEEIAKRCQTVWRTFPQKKRYALWKTWKDLYHGQSYELFWVTWFLTELRVRAFKNTEECA